MQKRKMIAVGCIITVVLAMNKANAMANVLVVKQQKHIKDLQDYIGILIDAVSEFSLYTPEPVVQKMMDDAKFHQIVREFNNSR